MQYAISNTYCTHEGVQHADGKRGPTRKGLGEVQLCVRVVVIVLVEELNVGVVDWSTRRRIESELTQREHTALWLTLPERDSPLARPVCLDMAKDSPHISGA